MIEAADVAVEVLVVVVVGGRGKGKRGRWLERSGIGRRRLSWQHSLTSAMEIQSKVVDSVPHRPVWPEYTVSASNPVHSTPLFRTGKNTGRTGQFRAIPVGIEKSFFFFFFNFIFF